MMAHRKRIKAKGPNRERWLISYADFITLMFAFFVVMYAISSVNESKYSQLSSNLLGAFKAPPSSNDPIQVGEVAKQIPLVEPRLMITPNEVMEQQNAVDLSHDADLTRVRNQLSTSFDALLSSGVMSIEGTEDWLQITMGSKVMFATGSAEVTRTAESVIADVAMVIGDYTNPIQVEGHTDNVPIFNQRFRSNWELSAVRAATIVRQLQDEGLDPNRLAAVGYGEFHPLKPNTSDANREDNRRMVLLISRSAVTTAQLNDARRQQSP